MTRDEALTMVEVAVLDTFPQEASQILTLLYEVDLSPGKTNKKPYLVEYVDKKDRVHNYAFLFNTFSDAQEFIEKHKPRTKTGVLGIIINIKCEENYCRCGRFCFTWQSQKWQNSGRYPIRARIRKRNNVTVFTSNIDYEK